MLNNMPEISKEIISWSLLSNSLLIFIYAILIFILIKCSAWVIKKGKNADVCVDGHFLVLRVSLFALCTILIYLSILSSGEIIKCLFTPKLYLIEYPNKFIINY